MPVHSAVFFNAAKPVSHLVLWNCNTLQLVGHLAIHVSGTCIYGLCVCVCIVVAHTCTYIWPYVYVL